MTSISEGNKGIFRATFHFLNGPIVKERIKDLVGTVSFVFGLVAVYDIYQIARGRPLSSSVCSTSPKWSQIAHKVTILCAKISLVLSAGVSRPGVFILSHLVGSVFSTAQLNRVFGPNTIFKINPGHPRHVISFVAVGLAIPSVLQSMYNGLSGLGRKILQKHTGCLTHQHGKRWLTDSKMRRMTLFNVMTSRPTIHLGNQIGLVLLKST